MGAHDISIHCIADSTQVRSETGRVELRRRARRGPGAAQISPDQNALVSVHSATPDDLRGRVIGVWVMAFQAASLIGAFLAGVVADVTGVRAAMFAGAVVLAVISLGVTVAIRRSDWNLTPPKPAQPAKPTQTPASTSATSS